MWFQFKKTNVWKILESNFASFYSNMIYSLLIVSIRESVSLEDMACDGVYNKLSSNQSGFVKLASQVLIEVFHSSGPTIKLCRAIFFPQSTGLN
jgi:hypothetical protein